MRISCCVLAMTCLLTVTGGLTPAWADDPAPQVAQLPPDQAIAVLGLTVCTEDGKSIGRLVDVLVDAAGMPEAGVIDFGGFLGVGARKVAVHWATLHFAPANAKQPITLELTPDQIKAVPEYRDSSKPAPVVLPPAADPNRGPSAAPSRSDAP
jgi:hypothetical protein